MVFTVVILHNGCPITGVTEKSDILDNTSTVNPVTMTTLTLDITDTKIPDTICTMIHMMALITLEGIFVI